MQLGIMLSRLISCQTTNHWRHVTKKKIKATIHNLFPSGPIATIKFTSRSVESHSREIINAHKGFEKKAINSLFQVTHIYTIFFAMLVWKFNKIQIWNRENFCKIRNP